MTDFGDLPEEDLFSRTGQDWLLILLASVDDYSCAKILFILWRAWHLRNDAIFTDAKATIAASVSFLVLSTISLRSKINSFSYAVKLIKKVREWNSMLVEIRILARFPMQQN